MMIDGFYVQHVRLWIPGGIDELSCYEVLGMFLRACVCLELIIRYLIQPSLHSCTYIHQYRTKSMRKTAFPVTIDLGAASRLLQLIITSFSAVMKIDHSGLHSSNCGEKGAVTLEVGE